MGSVYRGGSYLGGGQTEKIGVIARARETNTKIRFSEMFFSTPKDRPSNRSHCLCLSETGLVFERYSLQDTPNTYNTFPTCGLDIEGQGSLSSPCLVDWSFADRPCIFHSACGREGRTIVYVKRPPPPAGHFLGHVHLYNNTLYLCKRLREKPALRGFCPARGKKGGGGANLVSGGVELRLI